MFVLQMLLMLSACLASYQLGSLIEQRKRLQEQLRFLDELQKKLDEI